MRTVLIRTSGYAFALAIVAASLAMPASAATILMESGMPGAIGGADPDTEASIDGGATFGAATIIPAHITYSTIPGTNWITAAGAGNDSNTIFRTFFNLPAVFSNPEFKTDVHADNVVSVYLNGTLIGSQPFAATVANFQEPVETFSTANSSLFLAGENELRFDVHNFTGQMGLNYAAAVTFDVGQPPGPGPGPAPVIPEPASIMLMGLGMVAAGRRRMLA